MRQLCFLVCVSLSLTLSFNGALAGPYEDASAARMRGDYVTAIDLLRPLADRGDPDGIFLLAVMHAQGQGVIQNVAAAVAMYKQAAELGQPEAQSNLAHYYKEGIVLAKDLRVARGWYLRSAAQGHTLSQLWVAEMFEAGQGGPVDLVEAHKWYSLAAVRFQASATAVRGRATAGRDRTGARMSPAQLAAAIQAATEWRAKPER